MRVVKRIIVNQYSGVYRRIPETTNSDPAGTRIVLLKDDGTQIELFKGSEFSEERLKRELATRGNTSKLEMKVVKEIIVNQYSGDCSRVLETIDSDLPRTRIVLLKDDGTQVELFRGSKFSEERLKRELAIRGDTSKLEQ